MNLLSVESRAPVGELTRYLNRQPRQHFHTRSHGCSSCVRQYFDAFDLSHTLVEGLDYEFGETFGEAENDGDFQLPRTIRFSVGVRF
jgi:hypothetical protein